MQSYKKNLADDMVEIQDTTALNSFNDSGFYDTLHHAFEEISQKLPEQSAIIQAGKSITYKALNQRANQLAWKILKTTGNTPAQILLLLNGGISNLTGIIGCMKAARVYVPLDASYPVPYLSDILQDSQASLVITDQKNLQLVEKFVDRHQHKIIDLDTLGEDIPSSNPAIPASPEDVFAIYYTSGSTGKPKGVMVNHLAIQHRVWINKLRWPMTSNERIGLVFSFSFGASKTDIFSTLLNGASLYPFELKKQGLANMLDWLDDSQISIIHLPVSLLREIMASLSEGENFPNLKEIAIGGQTIHKRDLLTFQKLFSKDCRLAIRYSTTETHSVSEFVIGKFTPVTWDIVPLGYPYEGKEILILDDLSEPLATGQEGEIAVRSQYVTSGYWRDPELTRKKFKPDPQASGLVTYLTGDLGRIRPDGMLEHLGRKDFQIKVRGFRVEPRQIETAIYDFEEVKQVVVVPQALSAEDTRLIAYIVAHKNKPIDETGIRHKLGALLPEYMLPSSFVFMDSLPKTVSGKVDRKALPPVDFSSREAIGGKFAPPGDELEKKLVRAWEEVLQLRPIGVHDNFFDLGGDSLAAMQLFVCIEKELGERMPLSILIKASTIEAQANLLRDEGWKPDWSSLVPLRLEGNLAPMYFMAPGGGNILTYRDLVANLEPGRPCYALQSIGMDGVQKPFTSLSEIAAHYIEEIKSVHPGGPFLLGGSSFGGKVAYAMAQQLHDQGEQVALVAMFDSRGINYPRKLPGMTYRRKKLFKLVRDLQKHLGNLWLLPMQKKSAYLIQRTTKVTPRIRRWIKRNYLARRYPMPEALKQVEMANRKARYTLEPPRFGGRLLLFRASQQPIGIYLDPTSGWGTVAGDRLEVDTVPGNHTTIIYEPRVGELAQKLNQILRELPSGAVID